MEQPEFPGEGPEGEHEETERRFRDFDDLTAHIEGMIRRLDEHILSYSNQGKVPVEGFFSNEDREHIFEFAKGIAEYAVKENIENIALVDRSARPIYIGVLEYMRARHPDKHPGIFFVNGPGFRLKNFDESPASLHSKLFMSDKEKGEKLGKRFSEVYTHLVENKEKPLLVFDTCVHDGETLGSINEALTSAGFKDVRLGSVSPPRDCDIKLDLMLTDNPDHTCYPFSTETMVGRGTDVVAERSESPEGVARAAKLRLEIKKIVEDGLAQESAELDGTKESE